MYLSFFPRDVFDFKISIYELAGKMAQQVKAITTMSDHLNSVSPWGRMVEGENRSLQVVL